MIHDECTTCQNHFMVLLHFVSILECETGWHFNTLMSKTLPHFLSMSTADPPLQLILYRVDIVNFCSARNCLYLHGNLIETCCEVAKFRQEGRDDIVEL